ncbi:HAD family acid phosphatase [Streptomyces sp. NPDC047017]|uniref:HAD family acid phosphatase n=1 Tax=Streptomyces sp. NPDC047017 TaxID=3155024 RepID=UPI0033CAE5C4
MKRPSVLRRTGTGVRAAVAGAVAALLVCGGVAAADTATPTVGSVRAGHEPYNLDFLKKQINTYYAGHKDSTGHYRIGADSQWGKDVTAIAAKAQAYLAQRLAHHRPAVPAIMLDIDDTSISTYPVNADFDFGGGADASAADKKADTDNTYPVIRPVLRLAQWAHAHGVKVVFITGRHDEDTAISRNQLAGLGYPIDGLYLRPRSNPPVYLPCGTTCTAIPFKSNTRKYLEQSQGYDFIEAIGDQVSDYAGGYDDRGFKLPNPMYDIP